MEESAESFLTVTKDDRSSERFPEVVVTDKIISKAPFEEELVLPSTRKFTMNDKMLGISIKLLKVMNDQEKLSKENRTRGGVVMMTYIRFPRG